MDIIVLIPIILGICALFPLGFGFWGLTADRRIREQGVETDARIVEFQFNGRSSAPVVEYETEQGVLRVKSRFSTSRQSYSLGDTIRVRYDRDHPKRFRIVGNRISTITFSVLVLAGIFDLIMAAIIPLLLA